MTLIAALCVCGEDALVVTREDSLGPMRFLRRHSVVDGIPVHASESVAVVTGREDGAGTRACRAGALAGACVPARSLSSPASWTLARERAIHAAVSAHSLQPFGAPLADRVWFESGRGLVPVWRVRAATLDPPADWEILVHARTGAIVDAARSLQSADGTVFLRSPALAAPQRTALNNLPLGAPTLSGRFANVTTGYPALYGSGTGPAQLARADANGNFLYPLSDPRFAEVQLYYGIDLAHTRFSELGFQLLDRPLDGVVYSPQASQQGPFFLASAFEGRGGIFFAPLQPRHVDPALDLDIVFHEYAHAVVTTIAGQPRSRGFAALTEGFADYFAASFSDDANFGEFTYTATGPPGSQLRFLMGDNQYPRDLVSEPHQQGLIWAAALWDIRRELGRLQADRIALGALLGLNSAADFLQAGGAAVSAANGLYGSGARAMVSAVMQRRGILPSETIPSFSAATLTSNVPQPGSIQAGGADSCLLDWGRQYAVTVPPRATRLEVAVRGTPALELLVRYRRPVAVDAGGQPVFDYRFRADEAGPGIVEASSSPELQAGIYYLAVRNCAAARADYQVFAAAIGGAPDALWTSNLAPGVAASGTAPTGVTMNSRQFAFTVPAGTSGVRFSLQAAGNVDLYVAHNRLVTISDLGVPLADAFSATSANSETLTLTPQTFPNLRPGTYYLAVFNRDTTTPVRFSVSASFFNPQIEPNRITPLNAGVATQTAVPGAFTGVGGLSPQQFSIVAPANAARLTITASTIGDILVAVRRGDVVVIDNGRPVADYLFATSRGSTIEITPNSQPPLEGSTVYYVALVNFTPGLVSADVSYTVEVAEALPAISGNGVVHGASFGTTIGDNCWITILGARLAPTTRAWGAADFAGGRLPVQLDGVSVLVNGRPAYIAYISPTQINALTPADSTEGAVEVRVLTPLGQSPPAVVQKARVAPALFMLNAPGATRYAAAVHPDGTLVGRAGLFGAGLFTRPARPGDRVLLYGAGFGAVSGGPAGGEVFSGAAPLAALPRIRIGGADAVVEFAGLVSNGTYQFNVVVPVLVPGDHLVEAVAEGVVTQPSVYLTVEP